MQLGSAHSRGTDRPAVHRFLTASAAARPVVLAGLTLCAGGLPIGALAAGALYAAVAAVLTQWIRQTRPSSMGWVVSLTAIDALAIVLLAWPAGPVTLVIPLAAGLLAAGAVLFISGFTALSAGMLVTTLYYTGAVVYCGVMFRSVEAEIGAYLAAVVAVAGGLVTYVSADTAKRRSHRRAHEGLRVLSTAANDIATLCDDPGTLEAVVRYAARLIDAEALWIMHVDRDNDALSLTASVGHLPELSTTTSPTGETGIAQSLVRGGTGVLYSVTHDGLTKLSKLEREIALHHVIAVPISDARGTMAVLMGTRGRRSDAFTDDELHLLTMLSTTVGSKLQTEASIRAMRAAAQRDGLTGTFNHATFLRQLEAHVRRSGIVSERLSVIVLDVDHFKRVNDTVGHHVGNRVLAAVADRLRECSRITDVLARCGGDEFALILPDTDRAGARLVADRIDESVREVADELNLVSPSTASVGVATFPDDAANDIALFRVADARMYEVKRLRHDEAKPEDAEVIGARAPSPGRGLPDLALAPADQPAISSHEQPN